MSTGESLEQILFPKFSFILHISVRYFNPVNSILEE